MYVVRIWEGLGNQMFQYAFARAVECRTGQKVYLDTKRAYKESFELESKHVERPYLLNHFNIRIKAIPVEKIPQFSFLRQKTILDKLVFSLSAGQKYAINFLQDGDAVYHEEYFQKKGDYYAFGWFQQEAYFKDIREILLKEFTPKRMIEIPDELQHILSQPGTVAVHVRRGDFLKWRNACPAQYYQRAIEYMRKKIENPTFLLFSDDMAWAKENVGTKDTVIPISDSYSFKDYEELWIMSLCKNQIIANSTFSWWAAWLNRYRDKIVVAPSRWFGLQDNIVPKEWVIR